MFGNGTIALSNTGSGTRDERKRGDVLQRYVAFFCVYAYFSYNIYMCAHTNV